MYLCRPTPPRAHRHMAQLLCQLLSFVSAHFTLLAAPVCLSLSLCLPPSIHPSLAPSSSSVERMKRRGRCASPGGPPTEAGVGWGGCGRGGGGCHAHQRPSRPANHAHAATKAGESRRRRRRRRRDNNPAQSLSALVILSSERFFSFLLFQLSYLRGAWNIIEI